MSLSVTFAVDLIALYITFLVFYTIFVLIYVGVKKGNRYELKSWLGLGKVVEASTSAENSYFRTVLATIFYGATKFQFMKIVKGKGKEKNLKIIPNELDET